jgi:phospholipid/cholesterol/gamma-HCH transport system substrate-binding protein
MYRQQTRNFRVGLLVLGAVALFVSMLLFVIGGSIRSEKVHYFILYEENVKGMVVGSRVNFQGVPIGAVEDIRFQNGATLVDFSMDPSKGVIQDVTRARLDRAIVTGQVTIELEGYDKDAHELEPYSYIEAAADPMTELMQKGLPGILESIDTLLVETTELVRRVEEVVSADNLERIAGILDRVEGALDTLPPRVEELIVELQGNVARVPALVDRAEQLLGSVHETVDGEDLKGTLAALRRTAEGLDGLRSEAELLLGDARGTLGGARAPLRSALVEGRAALVAVRQLAQRLSDAPSSILYGVENSEISVPARPPR